MEHQPEISSEVILTTETFKGIVPRVLGMAFFGMVCIALTQTTPPASEWWHLAFPHGFALVSFLFMVLIIQISPRGVWMIDSEGVRFQPCHGRPRFLAWAAIERLQWENPVFKSQAVRIALPLHDMDLKTRALTRTLLEQRLSNDFDLNPIGPDAVPLTREQKRRLVIVSGITTAVVGVQFAGIIFAIRVFPESYWLIDQFFGISLVAMLFGPWFVGVLFLPKDRSRAIIRQTHPQWPWRIRRSKLKSTTSIDHEFELV